MSDSSRARNAARVRAKEELSIVISLLESDFVDQRGGFNAAISRASTALMQSGEKAESLRNHLQLLAKQLRDGSPIDRSEVAAFLKEQRDAIRLEPGSGTV